jgi:hypothetical protein
LLINYSMSDLIKKLPSRIKENKLKTGIFLGLSTYCGIILVGTLAFLINSYILINFILNSF